MEVNVTIEENVVCLITDTAKKDINAVMSEALEQWMSRNLPKCPIDESYCRLNEPCNNCAKTRKSNV